MTVTLSMEIELAWGGHDLEEFSGYISKDRKKETETLKELLKICDKLGISFSFDIVGHLLLDNCSGHHDGGHPDGWFDADPGTNTNIDPEFYAPDLLEMILNADTDHEVCTHTFSHLLCDRVSEKIINWELQKEKDLHSDVSGNGPHSMVPPRHRSVRNGLLQKNGIKTVRKPIPGYSIPENKMSEYIWKLTRTHPVKEPIRVDGVLETYCTPHPSLTAPYLSNGRCPPHPAFRIIPRSVRQKIHKKYLIDGLERSIAADSYIHFWTHLYNLSNSEQMHPVKFFLQYLSERIDNGQTEIKTMAELNRSSVI